MKKISEANNFDGTAKCRLFSGGFFSPKCSIGSNLFGIKRLRTQRERERESV